jgi:Na+/phosphate symporter
MVTILVPLLIAIAGALVYGFSANAKLGELGKICFAAGMFAIAFAMTGHAVHLF